MASAFTSWRLEAVFYAPGIVFGFLMVAHLYRLNGMATPRILAGMLASIFAYSVAIGILLVIGGISDSAAGAVLSMTASGAVGALVLDVLIRPLESHRISPKRLFTAAIVGAMIAAAAAAARETLDYATWFFAIFIAWQAAIAAVFGAFRQEPRPDA